MISLSFSLLTFFPPFLQHFNDARQADCLPRFCVKLSVRNWGDPVERLPLRWLRNATTKQCVVLIESRSPDNSEVEMCVIRCPYVEAERRGFMAETTTLGELLVGNKKKRKF